MRSSRTTARPPAETAVTRERSSSTPSTSCDNPRGGTPLVHRFALLPADYASLGVAEDVGRKLLASSVQRYSPTLRDVAGVRRSVLDSVEASTRADPLRIAGCEDAPDGFRKYLFELEDGARVEAVRIPVPCE